MVQILTFGYAFATIDGHIRESPKSNDRNQQEPAWEPAIFAATSNFGTVDRVVRRNDSFAALSRVPRAPPES
jgi:hypothetical protein